MTTSRTKKLSVTDQTFFDRYSKYIEVKSDGVSVFKGTNLSVFYVGSLLAFGETKTSLLSDYQSLNPDDLKYARMFYTIESNKKVEELVPNYDAVQSAIEKFRRIAEKKDETR